MYEYESTLSIVCTCLNDNAIHRLDKINNNYICIIKKNKKNYGLKLKMKCSANTIHVLTRVSAVCGVFNIIDEVLFCGVVSHSPFCLQMETINTFL